MATTERLGLDLLDMNDVSRPLLDVMQKLLGTDLESSLNRLDSAIGELQDGGGSIHIVEGEEQPPGLVAGDEWDRIISESSHSLNVSAFVDGETLVFSGGDASSLDGSTLIL